MFCDAVRGGLHYNQGMRWQQIFPVIRQTGRQVLDGLLPPLCLRCSGVVTQPGSFCADCWQKLAFITAPHCPRCGIPYEVGDGGLDCPDCLTTPPRFQQARAAVVYDDASRPLVLGFKHADQTHLAAALARLMLQSGRALLADCDGVVPVPLHRRRLFRRCYNQSALLAQLIAKAEAVPVWQDMLLRRRPTQPQANLSAKERLRNVREAFVLNPNHAAGVAGKTIVLIDDVLTTGATANDCCRALLAGGARAVRVLTFARTV